jgi:plasmid stabilization system protein ParE
MTEHERRTADAEALAELLGERARAEAMGPEPTTEELMAHLEGRLSDEETADLERRLAASPEATRDLLDLAELMAVEDELSAEDGDRPADLEAERGWRDLRGRLAEEPRRGTDHEQPPRRRSLSLAAVAAVAAVAVAALGLGVWIGQLGSGSTGSDGLVATRTLALFDDRSGSLRSVELAPEESLALLVAPPEECSDYTVEIERAETGRVSRLEGLRPSGPTGALELTFDPPSGRVEVRVLGCGRQLMAEEIEIVRRNP